MNRKVLAGILGGLIWIGSGVCEGKEFSLEFSPAFSVQNGILNEYVYTYSGNFNRNFKLSELNWHITNNYLYGENIGINYKNFSFNCTFFGGGETVCHEMTDSDWQNPNDLGQKTNLSISDNTLSSSFLFNTNLAYSFRIWDFFLLKPFFSLDYSAYYFEARNGEGWYGDIKSVGSKIVAWDDPAAKHFLPGQLCVIDYFRKSFSCNLGLSTIFDICNICCIDINASIPLYTNVNSLDTHYSNTAGTNGTCYNDKFNAFFVGFSINSSISFKISKIIKIGGFYSYSYIPELIGTTEYRGLNSTTYTKDTSSFPKCSGSVQSFGVNISFSY